MNILSVTNLYSPHYFGRFEVHCAQAAEALQGAGHQVRRGMNITSAPLLNFN